MMQTTAFSTSLALRSVRPTRLPAISPSTQGACLWRATATVPPPVSQSASPPQPSPEGTSGQTSAPVRQRPVRSERVSGTVVVLGLSHHTATVDIRERLAVKEDAWQEAAAALTQLPDVVEAAVLSTCNRFEVYLFTSHGFNAIAQVVAHLSSSSGISIPDLRRHLFMLTGNEAVRHLLRVSAGLDSLVIGEGQILSQVKRCYELATEKDGHAGKVLTRLLNTAVSAGKRVRSETDIAKGAVSISSAAVELAELRSMQDVGLPLADTRACILGAGKMSRLLVQHLLSRGVSKITIVNRSLGRAEELAKMFPDFHLDLVLADRMMPIISQSDIVFASTSATEPIVTRNNLTPVLSPGRKCMLVDISVPRNVSADVAELEDISSYNVDDLKAVVAKNQAKRRRLIQEAELLLAEEQTGFNNWLHSLSCVPAISKLQKRAEEIRQEELERVKGKLSGLSSSERKAVETLSKGIINKMLHSPMTHLRGLEDVEERSQTLEAIEALFRL